MRYVGDQITNVRRDTRNEDVPSAGTELGIDTEDFLRYLNYAQDRCVSLILNVNPLSFQTEKILTCVSGQEEYIIPDRVMAGERIVLVQHTFDGNVANYRRLPEKGISYRSSSSSNFASFYIRRNGRILLGPVPSAGGGLLRVVYERQPDTLDIRRGTVNASTITNGILSALSLLTTNDDETALAVAKYLCVSNSSGVVSCYNIPVTSYDPLTGIVTLTGPFTIGAGETVPAGSFVTIGPYTTTHSKLSDVCERYLELYTAFKVFKRDSSSDAGEAIAELKDVEDDIKATYQLADKDEHDIQIIDHSLIIE